jgi:hypothetical protein
VYTPSSQENRQPRPRGTVSGARALSDTAPARATTATDEFQKLSARLQRTDVAFWPPISLAMAFEARPASYPTADVCSRASMRVLTAAFQPGLLIDAFGRTTCLRCNLGRVFFFFLKTIFLFQPQPFRFAIQYFSRFTPSKKKKKINVDM